MGNYLTSELTTTYRGIQCIESKTVYKFDCKIIEFTKAGLSAQEIADALNIKVRRVHHSIIKNKSQLLPEQVCFGKKNESQDEDMYFNVLPKYNSYMLKDEELEIFNEGPAYTLKWNLE